MVNNKLNDGRLEANEHYFNPFPKSSRIPTDEELDYILNNDLPLVEEPKDKKKDKSKPKKRINIIKSKQDNDINNINDNINTKSQCKNSSNIHLGRKKKKNLDDINKYDIQLDQTTASLTSSTDSSKPTAIVNIKYIPLAKKLVKENSDFKGYEHANTAYDYKLPDFEYSKQYITAKWNRMQHCLKVNADSLPKTVTIKNIESILNHYFAGGKIHYNVSTKDHAKGYSFTMETCFSLQLYYKVWNYLFMNTKNTTHDLAPITKAYEIYKFIKLMKPVLSGELILEKALKNRVACNNAKGKKSKVRDIPQINENSRLYLFKDYKGVAGVRVFGDKGRNSFSLEEFKNYCEPVYYERLMKKYNKTKHKLKRERVTLDVMQLNEVMRKAPKHKKSKVEEKIEMGQERK